MQEQVVVDDEVALSADAEHVAGRHPEHLAGELDDQLVGTLGRDAHDVHPRTGGSDDCPFARTVTTSMHVVPEGSAGTVTSALGDGVELRLGRGRHDRVQVVVAVLRVGVRPREADAVGTRPTR